MVVELDKKTGKYMFAGKIYKDEKYSKAYVSRIYLHQISYINLVLLLNTSNQIQ